MKKSNILAVQTALQQQGGEATVRELVAATRLAQNTVRDALVRIGAVSDGYHPATWSLDPTAVVDLDNNVSSSSAALGPIGVSRAELPSSEVVERWEKAQKGFASNITKALKIEPTAKAGELSAAFLSAASTLATIGEHLASVADKPDWYELLGGTLDN